MSVECWVDLPPHVRVDDVADVLGKLYGAQSELAPLNGSGGGFYCKVDGVRIEPGGPGLTACARIWLDAGNDDRPRHLLYHFEYENDGHRGLSLSPNPMGVAVATRLVQFFGGSVDYDDSDSNDDDFSVKPDVSIFGSRSESDDDGWERQQHAMNDVHAITPGEVSAWAHYARYPA